jgi:hypothetical protein
MIKNEIPKINSRWRGSTHIRFVVDAITESEAGPVIHYIRSSDNKQFNCLLGAFLQRFTLDLEI